MSDLPDRITQLTPAKRALLAARLGRSDNPHHFKAPLPNRTTSRNDGLLSFAQERMWFLEQLTPGTAAYHVTLALRLRGLLDETALAAGLSALVARHDVLRTSFPSIEGRPRAVVSPPGPVPLGIHDLQSSSSADQLKEAQRLAAADTTAPFDLAHGPLLRITLLRLAADDHALLITLHHLVTDGESAPLLFRDVAAAYTAYLEHGDAALPPLPLQYADFAAWQRNWLEGPARERLLAYWREQMAGAPAVLELPADRPRPATQSFRGGFYQMALPPPLTGRLHRLARQEGATLFMLLLAAFQTMLARITGQTDIVVGAPMAHRTHTALEPLIGCFVNTLPLRTRLDNNPTARSLLAQVKETCLAAHAHQDLPFELLVDALQPARSLSHAPLFQVVFAIQPFLPGLLDFAGLSVRPIDVESGTAKFDLSVMLVDRGSEITGVIEYNSDLFERETIGRLAANFQTLLQSFVEGPDRPVSELPLLTNAERAGLLSDWDLKRWVPSPVECIHELVAHQAARTPLAVAVVCNDRAISYAELDRRANQLAHWLCACGIGPEQRAGVCLERSIELVVALLAVLKAGGAYLPLDPAYPSDRLAFMLGDAGAPVVLTEERFRDRFENYSGTVVCMETIAPQLEDQPGDSPPNRASAANLAYVIYTSGSTGAPKGVAVPHASLVSLFQATSYFYKFDEHDVWTAFHSPAFDFSVWEIWGALIYGGRLVMVPYFVSRSPEVFYALLHAQRVTVLNQTPSAFRQLVAIDEASELSGDLALRWVIFGGEALDGATLAPWFARHGDQRPQLVNMYGITEITVHGTWHFMGIRELANPQASIIGSAIPNTRICILDRHLDPTPAGVVGEIYVGGTGLARGYLHRPELTAERFVPDPFGPPGTRLYRTGDLARRRNDGALEYLGRCDQQVKVRGFRIEVGEVEAALLRQPSVREVVVVAIGADDKRRLVAYIVPAGSDRPTVAELRRQLQQSLPDYMLPAAVMWLKELPLTRTH
jgi:fengycin family lipopeptide synthetase B